MNAWEPIGRDAFDVYVISDLHLGGEPKEGARGFRLMTLPDRLTEFIRWLAAKEASVELVINGDFVDFLAESHEDLPQWRPLLLDEDLALRVFRRIVSRGAGKGKEPSSGDAAVFDALHDFVAGGHRLTVLLGNHDVELSYPRIRAALFDRIGGPIEFIYDNEALVRGDVVIEHGNRYDRYNQIDHDGLRRLRSTLSRHGRLPERGGFAPPPGSRMVAGVMNVIKREFPFVDLLKPETGAVLPILLTLRPSLWDRVVDVVRALGPAVLRGVAADGSPRFAENITSTTTPASFAGPMGGPSREALHHRSSVDPETIPADFVERPLSPEEAVFGKRVACDLQKDSGPTEEFAGPISARNGLAWLYRILRPFVANPDEPLELRLLVLLKALRLLDQDRSFSADEETNEEYEDGARTLHRAGFRYVIFGHTHLPKHVRWPANREYLNSGTWADRIRLPKGIFDPDDAKALTTLKDFLVDLRSDHMSRLLFRDYTYVWLRLRREPGRWFCHEASLEHWPEAKA